MNASLDRSVAQRLAAWIPLAWLVVFFLAPFLIVLKASVSLSALSPSGAKALFGALSLDNYARLAGDPHLVLSYVNSVQIAAFATLLLLVIGYPIAYGIARLPRRLQPVLVALVMLPFCTALLVRVYAWADIMQPDGPLDRLVLALHIVREPQAFLATDTAIYIGIVYAYLPLMVLPLYVALRRLDAALLDAAADLGCPRWRTFWLVTLPLSAPGVLIGALLCFIPIAGEFVVPDLLGGAQTMVGQIVWAESFGNRDWPMAAAVAVTFLCFLAAPIVVLAHQAMRAAERD